MTLSTIPTRFQFSPATTDGAPARILLMGPSGSGKTYTALRMAETFGPNPGLIDTENKRSRRYAPLFKFSRIDLDTFDPADLTRALAYAAAQGIDPVIIDTATPFWNGPDGMLERVGREKSSFDGWKKYGPVEQQMMAAVLTYPGHVIAAVESKVKYTAEEDAKGKLQVSRVGMEPIQRDGFTTKFDLVLDMDRAVARVGSTCLCPELTGQVIDHPGPELAETILAWLRRDAVGEPLNPVTVAGWAMEEGRTRDELAAKYRELETAGQTGAIVANPFHTGGEESPEFVTVGALLRRVNFDLKRAEERAAATTAAAASLGDAVRGAAA